MAQIILEYNAAANNDGVALNSNNWTDVGLNLEVRDTGGNCVLAANQFTLSAGAYPKNCRIKAWVNMEMTGAGLAACNARLGLMVPAVSSTVPIIHGLNLRVGTPGSAARASGVVVLEHFFVLAAATTYLLRLFNTSAVAGLTYGSKINSGGLLEKYGAVEILIE